MIIIIDDVSAEREHHCWHCCYYYAEERGSNCRDDVVGLFHRWLLVAICLYLLHPYYAALLRKNDKILIFSSTVTSSVRLPCVSITREGVDSEF